MTKKRERSRQLTLFFSVLLFAALAAVACSSPSAPAAENSAPTSTIDLTDVVEPTLAISATDVIEPSPSPEATIEPEASPTTGISVHPADLRTGLDDLDRVLEAIASGDIAQIAARMRLLDTGCTTADGLGGPPKCEQGQAEGTMVTVFPLLGAEGTFATAEQLPELAETLDIAGLFGVYRVTSGPGPEEAYWPSGDYGIVLAHPDPQQAYTLIVQDGDIVRLVYHYVGGPEQAFDGGRGEIVIPPLQ